MQFNNSFVVSNNDASIEITKKDRNFILEKTKSKTISRKGLDSSFRGSNGKKGDMAKTSHMTFGKRDGSFSELLQGGQRHKHSVYKRELTFGG